MVRAEGDSPVTDPDPPESDDSALLRLARSGDQDAIEALCRRNWRPVYRSFARYTRDPAEAEDLTQEVFVRALRALPRFTDKGVPYTAYLLGIAANQARDRWRAVSGQAMPVADVSERPSRQPGPDALAIENDRRAALRTALDRIRPDQRTVLRLRIPRGAHHPRGGRHHRSQPGCHPAAAGPGAGRAPHRVR